MKIKENENYISPEVEVVKIAIEKGFAASAPGGIEDDEDGGEG